MKVSTKRTISGKYTIETVQFINYTDIADASQLFADNIIWAKSSRLLCRNQYPFASSYS